MSEEFLSFNLDKASFLMLSLQTHYIDEILAYMEWLVINLFKYYIIITCGEVEQMRDKLYCSLYISTITLFASAKTFSWWFLTRLSLMHRFLPHENIRKPQGFLIFSWGRERVHWEQMGCMQFCNHETIIQTGKICKKISL